MPGSGKTTKSGVFVFDDFRDNLIIDRYDPVFTKMREKKIYQLSSENSEDALTWNTFRSLQQINPVLWYPDMFTRAFGGECTPPQKIDIHLWFPVSPPPELRQDEGDSEIDVLIETENSVWAIEAKFKSDISTRTTHNPDRDQILRNIDVGSRYAGMRNYYFALLFLDKGHSPVGVLRTDEYAASNKDILKQLLHRSEGLDNLKGIGKLTWEDVRSILSNCSQQAKQGYEQYVAKMALDWLQNKISFVNN